MLGEVDRRRDTLFKARIASAITNIFITIYFIGDCSGDRVGLFTFLRLSIVGSRRGLLPGLHLVVNRSISVDFTLNVALHVVVLLVFVDLAVQIHSRSRFYFDFLLLPQHIPHYLTVCPGLIIQKSQTYNQFGQVCET